MRSSIGICSAGRYDLRPRLRALDDGAEGADQAEEIDFDLGLGRLAGDLGDRPVGARPLRAAQRLALVQELGRRLELLVLEQPAGSSASRGSSSDPPAPDRDAAAACAT
jgi:hypothetical protein